MWIVILNFCLFILLIGFMFYGLYKWSKLITEYNDGSEGKQDLSAQSIESPESVTDEKYYRLPIWILFAGIGISQLLSLVQQLLGYK